MLHVMNDAINMFTMLRGERARSRNMEVCLALAAASTATAQIPEFTATNLQPAAAYQSAAMAVSGGRQAGSASLEIDGVPVMHAAMWSGTATSWVDLNPLDSAFSIANAINATQQAGYVVVSDVQRACLWNGTAASWIDLQPIGAAASEVRAMSGEQQAGWVDSYASLWSGTAASCVNLNPMGALYSGAFAIDGVQQAGYAVVDVNGEWKIHAGLWSGTAESWVDLHPEGSTRSVVYAAGGGQQVGEVMFDGIREHASLWSGTAESRVDLHPPGAAASYAYGVSGGLQVGWVELDGVPHASLWSGTAESWVDLGPGWANAIYTDGADIFIAGVGGGGAQLWTLSDKDGDGIYDDWEINGIPYKNADGQSRRYMLSGANPLRKDMYIEVDSMIGRSPMQSALDRVIASFDAAPVPAPVDVPGGLPGITLHVELDINEQTLPRHPYPNGFVEFHQDKALHFGTPAERADHANWPMIKEAKARVYRYCIFADSHHGVDSSGLADLPGNDFMVTLGLWLTPGGTEQQQAGTFMHELGHTLGLGHGGDQLDANYKPNYFSIMNYLWQFPKTWLPSGTGPGYWESYFPNYSDRQLPTLDEHSLNEVIGIQGHIPTLSIPYSIPAGTENCDDLSMCLAPPSEDCLRYARFSGPVDWDNDCNATSRATAPLDINVLGGSSTPSEILTGFNDWPHLLYNFRGQPDSAEGAIPTNSPVEIDLATDLYLNSLPPPPAICRADFNGDGEVDFNDYLDFVDALSSSTPPADFNYDGSIDFNDYLDFVDAFSTSC